MSSRSSRTLASRGGWFADRPLGVRIGAVVALLLDRAGSRHAKPARLERVEPATGIAEGTPGLPDARGPRTTDPRDEDPRT